MDLSLAAALVLLAAALPLARPARASTADVFGLGSESTALAGAVTARATGFDAAFYNPAGLTAGRGYEAALGFAAAGSQLQSRGRTTDLSDPFGLELGLRLPVPLGGVLTDRLTLGLALHFLPDQVL